MSKKQVIIFLSILTTSLFSQSFRYEEQDTFFTELEQQLKNDFKSCTGDTVVPELKYLLEWKNRIHLQTQTEEYKNILKEYMVTTGILEDIIPCNVLSWHKSRIQYLNTHENKAESTVLENVDRIVDSIGFINEIKNNPPSNFDFEEIPFGFSKKYFLKLYTEKFYSSPIVRDSVLITEHFLYKETPFILRFYFNKDDRFYKYEIESYSHSGNDLNDKVRHAANLIKKKLTEKAGEANNIYRIGYFDIKTDKPTLYASWEQEDIESELFYSIKDERYYTYLTVIKNFNIKK